MPPRTHTRLAAVALLSVALASNGCSTTGAAGSWRPRWLSSKSSEEDAQAAFKSLQPPDGKWLKDENGAEYFIHKVEKKFARRLDEKTVKLIWGIPIDVVSEDENYFYYKYYKVEVPPTAPAATSADKSALVAAYQTKTKTRERFTWIPFGTGLPESGQWRDGFAIADMNKDGHPDIVHGPVRKVAGPPTIFLGDGKGGWTRWKTSFPKLDYDYGDAKVADFDGDGNLDIALAAHLKGQTVLLGDGHGAFRDASTGLDKEIDGKGYSSRALEIVDWNHDGHPDLLVQGEGPAGPKQRGRWSTGAIVYLNQGDGTWLRQDPTEKSPLFGASLALGDFDGDGKLDFATASSVQGRKDIVDLATDGGDWKAVDVDAVRPGSYVWAVAAGDIDGDGRTDLVVAYSSYEAETWHSGLDILYARGASWERATLDAVEGTEGPIAVAVGDLAGDKHLDVVALTAKGSIDVYVGDGRGSFTREKNPPVFAGGACRGAHVAVADLDGDGQDEIVASFADEQSASRAGCPSEGGMAAWKARKVKSWWPW